jgi:hypothetical protein
VCDAVGESLRPEGLRYREERKRINTENTEKRKRKSRSGDRRARGRAVAFAVRD